MAILRLLGHLLLIVERLRLEVVKVDLIHLFPIRSTTATLWALRLVLCPLHLLLGVVISGSCSRSYPLANQVLLALLLFIEEMLLGEVGLLHNFTVLACEYELWWTRSDRMHIDLMGQNLLNFLWRLNLTLAYVGFIRNMLLSVPKHFHLLWLMVLLRPSIVAFTQITNLLSIWHKEFLLAWLLILLLWILVTVEYLLAGCASILFEHLHLHLVTRLTVRYATFFRSLVIVDTVSFWATQTTLLFAHLVNNLVRSFTRWTRSSLTPIPLHTLSTQRPARLPHLLTLGLVSRLNKVFLELLLLLWSNDIARIDDQLGLRGLLLLRLICYFISLHIVGGWLIRRLSLVLVISRVRLLTSYYWALCQEVIHYHCVAFTIRLVLLMCWCLARVVTIDIADS